MLWKIYLNIIILCLDYVVLAKLLKDDQGISKDDIPVYLSVDKLPTPKYKQRIHQIYNQFFSDEFIQGYLLTLCYKIMLKSMKRKCMYI